MFLNVLLLYISKELLLVNIITVTKIIFKLVVAYFKCRYLVKLKGRHNFTPETKTYFLKVFGVSKIQGQVSSTMLLLFKNKWVTTQNIVSQ